jgi:hypothetical protein
MMIFRYVPHHRVLDYARLGWDIADTLDDVSHDDPLMSAVSGASLMPDPNKTICELCHQPLGMARAGVRLPPIKSKIFDVIKAAGDKGATALDVLALVYDGRKRPDPLSVKSHIAQINDLLEETDLVIKSDRIRKEWPHWRLVRREPAKPSMLRKRNTSR